MKLDNTELHIQGGNYSIVEISIYQMRHSVMTNGSKNLAAATNIIHWAQQQAITEVVWAWDEPVLWDFSAAVPKTIFLRQN